MLIGDTSIKVVDGDVRHRVRKGIGKIVNYLEFAGGLVELNVDEL